MLEPCQPKSGRRPCPERPGTDTRGEAARREQEAVLQALSDGLPAELGAGWSVSNPTLMRRFFLAYRDRLQISQTPSAISRPTPSTPPFTLSWSHYVFLLGIDDEAERAFYEVEATRSGWSLRGPNVHAREHRLVLPSKADLRRKLLEWTGDDET